MSKKFAYRFKIMCSKGRTWTGETTSDVKMTKDEVLSFVKNDYCSFLKKDNNLKVIDLIGEFA